MAEPDRINERDTTVGLGYTMYLSFQSGESLDYKNGLHTAAELLGKKAEKLVNFMNQVQYVHFGLGGSSGSHAVKTQPNIIARGTGRLLQLLFGC